MKYVASISILFILLISSAVHVSIGIPSSNTKFEKNLLSYDKNFSASIISGNFTKKSPPLYIHPECTPTKSFDNSWKKQNKKFNCLNDINPEEEVPKFDRYSKDEFIVKLTPGVAITPDEEGFSKSAINSLDKLNQEYGVIFEKKIFGNIKNEKVASKLGLENVYLCRVSEISSIQSIQDIIKVYQNNPYVLYAQPNYIMETYRIPNDPFYHSHGSWGQSYDDLWGLKNIHCEDAWNITTGSSDIIVAVVDTGIDYTHEDIADNIWINEDEIPDNGIDDDHDGFIDNIHGADFAYNDSDPMDGDGHGTHCAGIIGAIGNNSMGVVGVNWNVSIIAVKALDDAGCGYVDDLAEALCWAADQGAKVISNSWGHPYRTPSDPIIEDAVRYAYNEDCILVFAAGNNNDKAEFYSPQNMEETITVGAIDPYDEKAYFSNWDEKVDVCAPGVDILSLRAKGTGNPIKIVGEKYYRSSGTSMSCPFVAGLCALILSTNSMLHYEDIKRILQDSSDDIRFPYIGGKINLHKAITYDIAPAKISSPSRDTNVKGSINIIGTASGKSFQYYIIEYGRGYHPVSWIEIKNSTYKVENGILASLDTKNLEDGAYTIRLKVIYSNGTVEDTSWMVVNNNVNIFTVGVNGNYSYESIQDAIDEAGDGDEIHIANGVYSESLFIDRGIKLYGEKLGETFLLGDDSSSSTITIFKSGVFISNITFASPILDETIFIYRSDNCNINNVSISHTYYGIYLWGSNFSRFSNISFNYVGYGFYLLNSSNNLLLYNQINCDMGILLYESSKNSVIGNTVTATGGGVILYNSIEDKILSNIFLLGGIFIRGNNLEEWDTHIIRNNTVNGKPIMYLRNRDYLKIEGNSIGQVILVDCSHIFIQNTSFKSVTAGVTIGYSNDSLILNCSFSYNAFMFIFKSSNNTIQHCIFSDNYYTPNLYINSSFHSNITNCVFKYSWWHSGLLLSQSSDISIHNCNSYGNGIGGIYLVGCSSISITDCTLYNNDYYGLFLKNSSKNLVSDNLVEHNWYGITIKAASDNTIRNNSIVDNYDTGIWLDQSSQNVIYYNFFKNLDNVYLSLWPYETVNLWYNPVIKKGNYWYDYDGTDADGDGIGDTPYNISSNNQDIYPLGLFNPIPDFTFDYIDFQTIQFHDLSIDPDGDIVNWYWDFGDGNTSNEQNPVHKYNRFGYYTVVLRVTDNDGKKRVIWKGTETLDNTAPSISIVKPKKALYINNKIYRNLSFSNPIIIGDIEIIVNATDDFSGIDLVEFYVNGRYQSADIDPPYTYLWDKKILSPLHRYKLKIIAYDKAGNSANCEMIVHRFL